MMVDKIQPYTSTSSMEGGNLIFSDKEAMKSTNKPFYAN